MKSRTLTCITAMTLFAALVTRLRLAAQHNRYRLVVSALTLCLACILALGLSASAQRITTFDAPGAGTAAGQGTFALGMTPSKTIEGTYVDGNGAFHGFLRASNGVITTFDVPEAGTGPGQGTQPQSINPAGAITGFYTDATGLNHGFVRAPDGGITSFDAPGAGRPVICPPPIDLFQWYPRRKHQSGGCNCGTVR